MAYQYYMAIDAQSAAIGSDETNFPCALVLTSANLKTVGNGGHIQNTDASGGASGSLTVPADFVVSPNADGSSPYDFEIVDYDSTTGYIELWVEITSLSSSVDNTIYLCYGDNGVTTSQEDVAGTWGNNFVLVMHLGEAAGTFYDSTTYGNDSTAEDITTYGDTGQIGDAPEFESDSTDGITVGDADSLSFTDALFTIQLWFKAETLPDTPAGYDIVFINKAGAVSTREYQLTHNDGGANLGFIIGDNTGDWQFAKKYTVTGGLNTGQWYFSVWISDGSDPEIILNDTSLGTNALGTAVTVNAGSDLEIGEIGGGKNFDGLIDEIQISTTNRDSDWLLTSYKNQDDPTPSSTFWGALGAEVERVVRIPRAPAAYNNPAVY